MKIRKLWTIFGISAVLIGLLASLSIAFGAGVDPTSVSATVAPGDSINVNKTVTTPAIPPKPDIIFLADTTGSMGAAIGSVQSNIGSIISTVLTSAPDAQFGAAQYKDVGDVFVYNLDQAVTSNTAAVTTAVNSWSASGGGDTPEAQLYALDQLATTNVGFRSGSTRIVVWFGDSSGHDPSNGVTLASAIADLTGGANSPIRVIAVPVTSGGDGLDNTGQATAIATATGGTVVPADPSQVAAAILAGLTNLPVTVSPSIGTCDPSLAVSFDVASQTVTSGDNASFVETVGVASNAPQGSTVNCTVNWLLDGNPVLLPDGTADPAFVETIAITVPDVTPPVAACVPTVNPAGTKVPGANANPKAGQNPDGFYQVNATDNLDPNAQVFVVDSGSGTVFGPFPAGTNIKYTQAQGATPSQKSIGGPGSAVQYQITGTGDASVYAVDASGNTSTSVACLVPPPPK